MRAFKKLSFRTLIIYAKKIFDLTVGTFYERPHIGGDNVYFIYLVTYGTQDSKTTELVVRNHPVREGFVFKGEQEKSFALVGKSDKEELGRTVGVLVEKYQCICRFKWCGKWTLVLPQSHYRRGDI